MALALFMASPLGRILRVVLGLVLIWLGLKAGTTGGIILAIIGLVPLAAGAFNLCFFAPLLGVPFKGGDLKKR